MLTIDELERFSATWGHSQYFPLTARGLYAAITDQTNARAVADCGTWIRPDIVEHCARVLRLRVVSAMHRSHIEYFSHVKSAPPPLAIPKKGSTHSVKPSRLDVIRMEVGGRILRQDAMWHGPSVYLPLPDPRLLPETGQMSWQLSSVLPAAGLQCVISIPPTSREDGCVQPLSVSSESCARSVWRALLSQHNTLGDMNDLQETVLKQSTSWKAFVMPGRPESHSEPTLSMRALEMVYHCLPQLTPASLAISSETSDTNSRAKRRRAKKSANEPVSAPVTEAVEPTAVTCLDADVSYAYSLYRPGHPSAEVDGRANKTVPVYSAQNIFGPAVSSTVIPWLLQTPARSSSSVQYVGVVALPCTVELATQLHRLVAYTNNV
ncbi:hypothetical protein GGI20_002134 [Coemansia sp. BCRC 34301]|nr:hypothetical protein GGI20_002134 [Coemansia sp. BCRC 34301]